MSENNRIWVAVGNSNYLGTVMLVNDVNGMFGG